MMHQRQDIDAYLASAPADDALAPRLALTREVLAFAGDVLDLPPGDAYQRLVVTGRAAVTWNVIATPELSLEAKKWCHLVAGCLPYLGWFDESAAQRQASRLAADGLDTAVSPATAYTTLGWFEDPVLDTMLSRSDAALAATLIHELAQRRLFVRGDATFSESYATFIEQVGTRAWLAASERPEEARQWEDRRVAVVQFNRLLSAARKKLRVIYDSDQSDDWKREAKQEVFSELRQRHDALVRDAWEGRAWFSGWFEPPPNNADLALSGSYMSGQCAFQALFEAVDGDFARFNQRMSELSRESDAQRADWLSRDC
jgi:predicted aminopeptidase